VHEVKFETVLTAPLVHILALLAEVDLFRGWNRFVVESATLSRAARFTQTLYAASWIPPPFPDFDVCVRVRGHDAGEPAAALVMALVSVGDWAPPSRLTGAGDGDPPPPEPAAAARRHRTVVHEGSCIRLRPLAPDGNDRPRTHATLVARLDPRLPYVPAFLVTWFLKVLSPAVRRAVQAACEAWFAERGSERARKAGKFAGVLPARMAARAGEYGLVTTILERRVSKRGGLPDAPPRPSRAVRRRATLEGAVDSVRKAGADVLRRVSSAVGSPPGSPGRVVAAA